MKISELKQIIEGVVSEEVRKTIIKESLEGKKDVYHVTYDGEPIDTFDTEEEAQQYINDNKDPKKELLIDKKTYDSHADMIEKLDQMGQELEEKEKTNMENTEPMEGNAFTAALIKAKEAGEKTFTVDGEEHEVEECWNQMEEEEMKEEEECQECGGPTMEEETCEKCGKEICECGSGMYESKKKTLRLTESELISLITKMVNESVPGLDAAKKSHTESGKENSSHLADVDKKMKDYLSIPGNNNNEFPEQNKKGDSVKVNNTSEEDEFVADQRGRGLENLEYDHEPSEQFKKRLKMSLEGDKTTGNSHDAANVVKTDLPKKLEKEIKRKSEDKKEEPRYNKEAQPTKSVNESKVSMSAILLEEMNKMKKLTNYNEKTQ